MSVTGPTVVDLNAKQAELDEQLQIVDIEDTQSEENESADGSQIDSQSFQTLHELEPIEIQLQQRYWFYCREWGLSRLLMKDVYNTVIQEASATLNPDPSDPAFVAKTEDEESIYYWRVVEIDDGFAECKSLETDKTENIHLNDLEVLYNDDGDHVISKERQLILDMYNFFTTFVYPPWGQLDESLNDVPFEPLLRERLNLFQLLSSEAVPKHAEFRYRVQKMEFEHAYEDLDKLTSVINEIQKKKNEIDESEEEQDSFFETIYNQYARCYRHWLYHAEALQKMEGELWDEHHITSDGPTPIVRKINGERGDDEGPVNHLVAENLTVHDITSLNLCPDARVRSYATLDLTEALQNCHEGDSVILFPGTYEVPFLCDYLFHESVTVKGCTDNAGDVILLASDRQRFFILADSAELTFENLTLNGQYHTDGAVCVRGGVVNLNNVVIRTDEVTRGVVIHPYAICKMNNCEVTGLHDISVDIKQAGTLEKIGSNKFAVEPAVRVIRQPIILSVEEIKRVETGETDHVVHHKPMAIVKTPQEGAGDIISA